MANRRELLLGAGSLAAAAAVRSAPALAQQAPFRIGVFVSERELSRPEDELGAQVEPYVSQMRLGLELAASEVNADGGLMGRPIAYTYVDDGGSPPTAQSVQTMVTETGVETIVSGFIQASPRLIGIRMGEARIPILHGFWVGGEGCDDLTQHFAPTIRQIVPLIREHLSEAAEALPFTISNWTPSGRDVSDYLYFALGGAHAGDALVTTPVPGNFPGEYRGVLRWADDVQSTVVWTVDPRPYAVNVANQAVELGIADGKTFAFADFSEWQAEQLVEGVEAISCIPFVASDPRDSVRDFVARARAMGSGDDLVTHVAFTHYNAIMALRAAIERSGEATAAGALSGFEGGLTIETATGPLSLEPGGYATMPLYVVRAQGGREIEILERLDAVPSNAMC